MNGSDRSRRRLSSSNGDQGMFPGSRRAEDRSVITRAGAAQNNTALRQAHTVGKLIHASLEQHRPPVSMPVRWKSRHAVDRFLNSSTIVFVPRSQCLFHRYIGNRYPPPSKPAFAEIG